MNAVAPKTSTSAIPAIEVGLFTFDIDTVAAIPADIPRAPNPNAMFFGTAFDRMPHHGHLFVPTSFWTAAKDKGGREIDPAKATIAYQKDKIRSQFKDWKKKDEENRSEHVIQFYPRKKGDELPNNKTASEDGLSVFMIYPEKLRPATTKAK